MKRIITLALILTFMICYLEWPHHSYFMFQMEYEFFFGGSDVVNSFSHPLILFPFLGQVLLLISLFLKSPPRALLLTGLLMLCPLVLMILVAGTMGMNLRIIASVLPFITTVLLFVKYVGRRQVRPNSAT